MKKLLYVFVSIILVSLLTNCNADARGKNEGIQFFKGDVKEMFAKAEQENKLIFVDVYASWCGPCKLLKKKTFPDKEVGTYFNNKFVNMTFDGEKGEGIAIAKKYNVKAYPTLLVIDSKGNVVATTLGYMTPEKLLEFGKSVSTKK